MNRERGKIICTAHAEGSTHDFKLYRASVGSAVLAELKIQAFKLIVDTMEF